MSLFLFDTLGDAVGFKRSYWVLIVVPLLPPMVHATARGYQHLTHRRETSGGSMPTGDPSNEGESSSRATHVELTLAAGWVANEEDAQVSPLAGKFRQYSELSFY